MAKIPCHGKGFSSAPFGDGGAHLKFTDRGLWTAGHPTPTRTVFRRPSYDAPPTRRCPYRPPLDGVQKGSGLPSNGFMMKATLWRARVSATYRRADCLSSSGLALVMKSLTGVVG